MTRAAPALLALLLVCSLPAITVVGAGPEPEDSSVQNSVGTPQHLSQHGSPTQVENTANRLELGGEQRGASVEHSRDLGSALAATDDALRVNHEQHVAVGSEFSTATTAEREQMIEDALASLSERMSDLETRERTAVRAHTNGELSDTAFLQILFRNSQQAAVLSDSLETLSDRADMVPGYSISVDDKQNELAVYQTDIRTQLDATTQGIESESTLVTLQTSETGYTLSTIDTTYLRETVRFDNRDTQRTNQFDDFIDAYDTAVELYPWVFETGGSSEAAGYSTVQLYWVRASHDHGQLETYFDGGTGDVYREIQELEYDSLPTVGNESWQTETLDLDVEQTAINGPAKVTVTDIESGDIEPATITIDGVDVGQTDTDDGSLWVLPPGDEYELTAETDTGSINATVSDL